MRRVQKIEIKGFRSLKHVSWQPDNLNVVIGPNGAGKSNFLWSLEFLRLSAEGNLRDSVLAEGGIRQLLWDHRAAEVAWTLKLTADLLPKFPNRPLTYDLALRPQGSEGGFYIDRSSWLTFSGSSRAKRENLLSSLSEIRATLSFGMSKSAGL